jgi:ATP-dependent Clp protease ATP-binding subunit ClpC
MSDKYALTPHAQGIIKLVEDLAGESGKPEIGIHHWLKVLLSENAALLNRMAVSFDPSDVTKKLEGNFRVSVFSISQILKTAHFRASALGKGKIGVRDIAAAVLVASGYDLKDPCDPIKQEEKSDGLLKPQSDQKGTSSVPVPVEETPDDDQPVSEEGQPASEESGVTFKIATPEILKKFGRDVTQQVLDGILSPVIGREEERQLLVETLCRRTKRNPILVGPAGVGKTAIVEGFAQRIVAGDVPDVLKGQRVVAIQPSAMVAGARYTGELEKRMQGIIEAASQDGIILFIDEFHSAIGTGGMAGASDMASILKPALARGDLACIAATTNSEYRRFVEPDGALERRFQPIRVNELSPAETLLIVQTLAETLTEDYQIALAPEVPERIVEFGKKYMHNRHFPDKAVDLLEQCFAHAVANELDAITLAEAQNVAQRMIGMPLDLGARIENLQKLLERETPLGTEDIAKLINRLQVTMRGLDLRNDRPNAVLLVMGAMQENSRAVSQTLSRALFNVPDRVITIDLSRMTQAEDLNLLVGAPPGYVGYADSLPLHQVVQMPWCILRLEHIDLCHPQIRSVLTQALSEGVITDGRGQSIFLSDTIVLLTTALSPSAIRSIGFAQELPVKEGIHDFVASKMGEDFAEQIDIFIHEKIETGQDRRTWIREVLLETLSIHYEQQGLTLVWDETVLDWLEAQELELLVSEWSRYLDETLTPEIIRVLPDFGQVESKTIYLSYDSGVSIRVTEEDA